MALECSEDKGRTVSHGGGETVVSYFKPVALCGSDICSQSHDDSVKPSFSPSQPATHTLGKALNALI